MTDRTGTEGAQPDAGLSLGELAGPVGVHRSTISRWKTNERRPIGDEAVRDLQVLEELAAR